MLREAQSGPHARRRYAILPWLLVASTAGACNLVAHTDDYAVGSGTVDSGIDHLRDGSGPSDGQGDALRDGAPDGSDSSPEGSAPCSPTIARAAISTPGGYQSAIGDGGYTFAFDDRAGSLSCIAPTTLCTAGYTAVADAADWGAAMAFNLSQTMVAGSVINPFTVPSGAIGISVLLSNLPPATRVSIDHGGVEYCVTLTAASATPRWSEFNTECWNNQGAFLAGPPDDATFIHFIVPAVDTARDFDFCVITLDFALGAAADGGLDGAADGGLDAAPESAADGGLDAAPESAADGGLDAAPESAADGGLDAPSESAADAVSETAADGAVEAAGD
jgi:hypothetical protein